MNQTQLSIIEVFVKRALESKSVDKMLESNLELISKLAHQDQEQARALIEKIARNISDKDVASNLVLNFQYLF